MDIISSIGAATKLCADAVAIAGKLKNVELKTTIVELKEKLLDAKEAAIAMREEIAELKAEVIRLSEPATLEFRDGLYFAAGGDGPFCTRCFDVDGLRLRVAPMPKPHLIVGKWKCPECKSIFQ